MRLFECPKCNQPLYFENTRCLSCQAVVGYDAASNSMMAIEPNGPTGYCANQQHEACNWLVEAKKEGGDSEQALCCACRLNNIVPDLSVPENLVLWRRCETAKHRLVYALNRLGLPVVPKTEDEKRGLQFDFVREGGVDNRDNPVFTTGHAGGLITLNINEADEAEREEVRQAMGEPYRTVLGHMRHEIAHYYWEILIADSPLVEEFRKVFGDERVDYGDALKKHYAEGPRADWRDHHISAYAAAHPWEDWAETCAHYLHITDTLETARAFGIRVRPRVGAAGDMAADITFDPYREPSFDRVLAAWMPLTFALNSLNRSMGFRDLYPFVFSDPVIAKLSFIHGLCQTARGRS